jgi:hypothetical protein
MRRAATRIALLVLVANALSCASSQARGDAGANDPSVITRAEVLELRFANALEAVQSLHPSWLQAKGADSFSSAGQVQVYLDENHLGGVETLATITPSSILLIRHYRALEATTRWGINHDKGAIVVSTHP